MTPNVLEIESTKARIQNDKNLIIQQCKFIVKNQYREMPN